MTKTDSLSNPEAFPDRNRNRLLELFHQCSKKIEELHTLYLESVLGCEILHERLEEKQDRVIERLKGTEVATKEFQDTCGVRYSELTSRDLRPVSMSPVMKQGALKERTRPNGRNTLLLGEQALVSTYAYWEELLRPELGVALGVLQKSEVDLKKRREILNKHVVSDLWGDIRYIRNSIVHNNSVANAEMSKCRVIQWFEPGDEIVLEFEKIHEIFLALGHFRNKIHTLSLRRSGGFLVSGPRT